MSTTASTISSGFLNDIKTQTADSHTKLERLPVSASIISPDMKLEDYTFYLSLMHDVHKDTEELVFPLLSGIIEDLEQRKKKQLIEDDLSYLNYTKTSSAKVFQDAKLTVPFAVGILYVMEGSTLGGRFILKNVSTFPELSNGKGVSYFNGYGDKTGSFWKAFLNFMAQYEEEHNCGDEIIEGAKYAFDSIYNHFESVQR
ncbi:biliverdin-producing heme oxygenase [Flavobacterium gelatinilyticum]|uniref:biliverdin-producing heme oxygenase n=1 Tax=Flavobacterium gelatinilyticum TaxID=3003260 RepID=UPI00247FF68F|nr:biliverdin-producing heme oxygenase [Flavobacterium gelatinilyticum]